MELFKLFLEDDDFQIKNRAIKIVALTELLEAGELSASEYEELIEDILDLEKVENQIADIKRKEILIKACQTMLKLGKVAAKAAL